MPWNKILSAGLPFILTGCLINPNKPLMPTKPTLSMTQIEDRPELVCYDRVNSIKLGVYIQDLERGWQSF